MIIYVSGPMSGIKDMNFPTFFNAEEQLQQAGHEVLNPARVDEQFPKTCGHESNLPVKGWPLANPCPQCIERTWRWYMRKCIVMLCEADGVATLPSWELSTGAKIEVGLAKGLGLKVKPVGAWLL